MQWFQRSRAEVIDLLLQHDISPTTQRIEIATALLSYAQHISAEEILSKVNRTKNKVSKATIYNTLGLFVQKGLVRELLVDAEKVMYDSNTAFHHHFYNVETGELSDISAQEVSLTPLPRLPNGTYIDSVEVIVRLRSYLLTH
jgi:Fur family transcriptional regulator, iron response regulator